MKTACCLSPFASLLASVALTCPAEMKADNPAGGMDGISSLYIKVELNKSVKSSSLKTGDVVEGTQPQAVYLGDRELFPVGSRMRLTVNEVERRRRAPNDHWRWVIKLFTPRHENYPTFQSGIVFLTSGAEIPLRVSLISITREREIHAQTRASRSATGISPATPVQVAPASHAAGLVATLEAPELSPELQSAPAPLSGRVTLPAGTQAKIILLGSVTASKSRAGDTFQARLVEPVRVGERVVLPEGGLFEGKLVNGTPPRWLSRAGSLRLTFTSVSLPGGTRVPVSASVAGAELDRRSHTKIDPEGKLTGERPGGAWMLINAGVTAGIAKEVDYGTQLAFEAIISTATDVSTAGTARIVGLCASSIFMLTRHGRDVVLPKFSELEITFDRPVAFGSELESQ